MQTAENMPNTTSQVSWTGRWIVVMTASLLFFYSFLQLNMLNTIGSSLMRDFSINAAQFGNLSAFYFYGNFLLLFPAGLLLDRFSTRKLILFAMALCVISMFGYAFSKTIFMFSISRFLSGVAGAFAFLSCIRLASRWFPPKQMALASGFIVTMAMIGGMVAQTPMALLSDAYGWRHAGMAIGWLGVFILIIMFIVLRDWPADTSAKMQNSQATMENIGFWRSIRMVIFNHYNWLGGVYTSLMNLPIFLLGALWGSMYLVQSDHLTHTDASYVTAMIFFGTIFGSPIVGWISDRLEKRILPMAVGAIVSLCLISVVIYVPHLSLISLMIIFFCLGLVTSTQILSYPLIAELNSPHVTGSAISVISLLIMASGFVFQPFFGWLLDLHWKHLIVHNVAMYSIQDFSLAMSIMPVAFFISMIVAFLIKETRCRIQTKDSE